MRPNSDALMANQRVLNVGVADTLGRRPPKVNAAPNKTASAGWGFTLPVLIICAALWFLLNAGHV